MDLSRKANREDHETTLQYKSRQETLLGEELSEDLLTQLQMSISQLGQTEYGAAELQRRTKLFGACTRLEGETAGQFYARLRNWSEKDMPPKSPLHAPRQTGE